jgi:hypothetical protein
MRFTVLCILLLLSGCHAQQAPPKSSAEIKHRIDIATKALDVAHKIGAGAAEKDIQSALHETIAAVYSQKILPIDRSSRDHATALRVANVNACVEASRINFEFVELKERLRGRLASDFTTCAFSATGMLNTLSYREDIDDLGYDINLIFPLAIVASAMAGRDVQPLIDQYRSTNEYIVKKLAPRCLAWKWPNFNEGGALEAHYRCVAYDGTQASAAGSIDRQRIDAQATRLTSRVVAQSVMPLLTASSHLAEPNRNRLGGRHLTADSVMPQRN